MILMVCIDKKNGIMFHGRRQSQDRIMMEHVLQECGEKKLYMNGYSGAMFRNIDETKIVVSDDFLEKAGDGDYCFLENMDIGKFQNKIEQVILYKWNRHYPADMYFTIDLQEQNWELQRMEEFKGTSHECITKEVYIRIR